MTAIATLPVLLQQGTHASRPAASAVGTGALYYCTTHSLIYQQLAGSWGTFWTFSTGFTDPMTSRGDIIIRNASNVTARLAKGSAGTYLGSDGTDVAYAAVTDAQLSTSDITTNNASTSKHGFLKKLSNSATDYMDGTGNWSTPAGGGGGGALVFLEAHTASSSATLDFTSFISSTYDDYVFHLIDLAPQNNNVDLYIRCGTGGGPSWDTGSNYVYNLSIAATSGGVAPSSTSATQIAAARANGEIQNTAGYEVAGRVELFNPQGTAGGKWFDGTINWRGSGNWVHTVLQAYYNSTTAMTGVRFYFSSGNIASGTIRVYGIAKS